MRGHHYSDWTNISAQLRLKFSWPVVPVDRLKKSVENLERIATQPTLPIGTEASGDPDHDHDSHYSY